MLRLIFLILLGSSLTGCLHFLETSDGTEALKKANPVSLARSLSQRGAHASAIAVLTKARRENPFDDHILSELAETYYAADAFERSLQAFQILLEKDTQNCTPLNGAGKAALRLRQYAKAAPYFEQCLVGETQNRSALSGLAFAANMVGEFKLARSLYLQLINLAPLDLNYRNNYATTLLLVGEFEAAKNELSSWIHYPQVTAIQRQNLALAFAMLGNWPRAREMAARDVAPEALDENMRYYNYLYHSQNREALRAALLSS
jgi:Flp pilus assembly protein TadD